MKSTSAVFSMTLVGVLLANTRAADTPQPNPAASEPPAQRDARMAWFREARFGMFIHWGVYAVPAGEWQDKKNYGEWFMEETKMPVSQYAKFVPQFNPVQFDAKAWVRMAKDAGMKYLVITSKHHDGFAIYPSDLSDWCIKSTPFKRDPLKELAEACREAGVRLCFYHSIMDWHHPDWGTRRKWNDTAPATPPNMDRYVAYMKGQLKELITRYGPLGILWFDGEWESPWTHERGVDLYNYVRSLQPDIIINNRVGKGRSGMQGMDKGQGVGDYGTPEQEIPATGFGPGVDWESCMTMNNHWGYNKHDQNWKSTQTLVRNLIDCASKGGNYLLNIGPTAEGTFPQASIERLAEIGRWMKVNRTAIYGTTASPFKRLPWGRCTKKATDDGATLYLHVFNWPTDGKLVVPGLRNKVTGCQLLADPEKPIIVAQNPGSVTVLVPADAPDKISSTVVLKVKGALDIEPAMLTQNADGSLTLPAAEAITHGEQIQFEAGANRDCIGHWLNPNDWVEWQFKITQPGKFTVTAEIAATGSGSFEVSTGSQKLQAKAPTTGDYGKFQKVELGTLEISAAGKTSLAVKPVRDGWQPFNLKSLHLKKE